MIEMQEKKQASENLSKEAQQNAPLRPDEIFEKSEIDYERQDVNGARIIGSFIIGTIVVAIVMFAISQYFIISREHQMLENALKPESNLLRDVRQREEGALNSYKVIDEKKGIYQIPISEAMKILTDEAYQKKKAMLEAQSASVENKGKDMPKVNLSTSETKKAIQK
ncbi:MAG: hypothetical protein ACK41G_09420 [Candidatus Thermochlorobacter sp.]